MSLVIGMPEVWPDETDGSAALVFQDPGVVPSSIISQLYLGLHSINVQSTSIKVKRAHNLSFSSQ